MRLSSASSFQRSCILAALLCLCLLLFSQDLNLEEISSTYFIDFLQYYAASILFLQGDNPYSPAQLFELQSQWRALEQPIRMWNPPNVFPFLWYLGFLPFSWALGLWVALLCLSAALAFTWLWTFSFFSRPALPFLICYGLSWYALYDCFFYGQIGFLLLLSSTGFFCLLRSADDAFSNFWAGLALTPLLVKPHSFFLFFLLFILGSWRKKDFRSIAGLCTGAAPCLLFPLLWNTRIYQAYFVAMREPPFYFYTPTLGSFLQSTFGQSEYWLRFLPMLLAGACLLIFFFARPKTSITALHLLCVLALSLLCSPYSWLYDTVVLLPFAYFVFSTSRESRQANYIAWTLLAVHLLLLLTPKGAQQHNIWYIAALPALGIWKMISMHRAKSNKVS